MYFELSEKDQGLIDLVKKDGETLEQTLLRIEKAFLLQCARDSESPEDLLMHVSSGELILPTPGGTGNN